ncbi:MAG: glycosyltransferase, partial [Dehalococcoidia bacterium]
LRALAWRYLMARAVSPAALFSILQAGLLLNHVLPMKAGEFARPLLLQRRGVPLTAAVTTTVLARALDVLALLAIAVVANGPLVAGAAKTVALAGALFATGVLVVVRLRRVPALPEAVRGRLHIAATSLRATPIRGLAASLPLVLLSWMLEAGMLIAAARLLSLDLAVSVAIGVTAFTILFQVIHITPGGLGLYEASMTGILVLQGMPADDALALALLTHGLKFGYALTVAPVCAIPAAVSIFRGRAADAPRRASRVEIAAARLWNVLNEGKPFSPTFALGVLLLLGTPHWAQAAYWARAAVALLTVMPLALVFWRFDFPLRLRSALWAYLLGFVVLFRFIDVTAVALVLSAYLMFTVVLWGTVYYHLRIGTPWTNFLRFWRLVLENPDPTSGNFLEQVPKLLLLVLAFGHVSSEMSWSAVLGIEGFTAVVAVTALLIHQRWFTWVPALPQRGYARDDSRPERTSKRVIVIAIDGCRADRLREARTPFIDRLRAEGVDYTDVSTVYPARTVTCFASMLTGAAPAVHGMRSNFVPSLGVKCESVFDVLRREGMRGVLVGIAHLVDAFGERDVRTVTAVMDNDEIDGALIARAKRVLEEEAPDLLVLQLLSVDQTGHARGSYHDEYLAKIEETDRAIERFIGWCEERGYLDGTTVLVTADHGQGRGIGGHGHMSPPEITVPCIWWRAGVPAHHVVTEPRFITEIAPTICHLLGTPAPAETVGRALLPLAESLESMRDGPVVFVVPAHNEEENLPEVLAGIRRAAVPGSVSVVVDDGSTDATAHVAEACGAVVVRHGENRGLGAALRTGLAVARDLDARVVVYLDADGEYDPTEAPLLLGPIERGEADYVLGSRFAGTATGMTRPRRAANAAFSLLLSVLCGRRISDGQTGMRAFSRRALEVAEIVHDYNYAQVLTLDLLHKRMRMTEVPITYRRRRRGRSFINAQYLWRVPLGIAREMLNG